jgi:hypothetical protein
MIKFLLFSPSHFMLTRFQHIGDPGAFGDWIVAVIALPNLEPASLKSALNAILSATADLKAFLLMREQESALHFTLRFSIDGSIQAPLLHEREVWPHMVKIPELRPAIAQYVRQLNSAGATDSFQDEGHARGAFAISELMLMDASYCTLFAELLFDWDMAHETFQFELIHRALKQYGCTPQTYTLLAARALADGQHAREQWCHAFADPAFRAAFDVQSFALACKRFIARAVALDIGLNEFADVYARGDQRRCERICAQLNAQGLEFPFEASELKRDYSATGLALNPLQHWDEALRWTTVENVDIAKLVRLS